MTEQEYNIGDVVRWKNNVYSVYGISPIIGKTYFDGFWMNKYYHYIVKTVPGQLGSSKFDFKSIKNKCEEWSENANLNQKIYFVKPKNIIKIEPLREEMWSAFWLKKDITYHTNIKIILVEENKWGPALSIVKNKVNYFKNGWNFAGISSCSNIYGLNCWEYMLTKSALNHGKYLIQGLNLPEKFDLPTIAQHPSVRVILKDEF